MHISRKDLIELSKPRIGMLILITSLMGFFLGTKQHINWISLAALCAGTFLSCCGSAMLNNFLERDLDKLMERTKNRALPAGRVQPGAVLGLGLLLVLGGVAILLFGCNLLSAFLSLLTSFLYVLVYTPMKRLSTLNTIIGAIPGALPAAGGVVAACGEVNASAVILFTLLFVWQMPHFFSIAWLCKEDYYNAGFRMLPSAEKGGDLTAAQIIAYSLLLIPISLLPVLQGTNGIVYSIGVIFAAFLMIKAGIVFASDRSLQKARLVLRSSLYYLPLVLISSLIDSAVS